LGNGESGPGSHRTRAVQVSRASGALTGVTRIATSGSTTCALRANGAVFCWGYAEYGQVGDGTTGEAPSHGRVRPVRVRQGSGYLEDVVAIGVGYWHSCAVKRDGSAWCWGLGNEGQLGEGASGIGHLRTRATRVRRGSGYLTKASGIIAGGGHACVRRTDRTAWCWGNAVRGQVGDGTTGDPVSHLRLRPVQVRRASGVLTGVTSIGTGSDHTCVRRSDGSAWCWGLANDGQLGDGTTGDPSTLGRLRPVRVKRSTGTFTRVQKVDGGNDHTCALRTDRTLWCWGSNGNGQLGRGSVDEDPHPYPRKVLFP
jgi:alpha-tubulin suppressor-like RCC1 family protein